MPFGMRELLALTLGSIARFNSLYVCESLFAHRLLPSLADR